MIKISNIITLISVNSSSTDPAPKARATPAFLVNLQHVQPHSSPSAPLFWDSVWLAVDQLYKCSCSYHLLHPTQGKAGCQDSSAATSLGNARKEWDRQRQGAWERSRPVVSVPNTAPQHGWRQDEGKCRIRNTFWCSLTLLHCCWTRSSSTEHKVQYLSLVIFSNH